MAITNTPKLDLLRVQEDWQFADDSFNRFIDDADDKLVGIAHLSSPEHWSKWEPNTNYTYGDIVRITNTKSHQYYQCIQGGSSGSVEPQNNVTGSVIINDGSVEWIVKSLSDESSNGAIKIWLSGENYIRGDVVLYGMAIYRCKVKHTATNWGNDNDNWQEIFSSIREWKPGIFYFGGDTVLYDNKIWYCLSEHISDLTWSVTEKQNWRLVNGLALNNWETSHGYKLDDLIIEGNIIYQCTQDHTSDSTAFSNDRATYWKLFHTPTATIKDWQANEYYEINQCVLYGGNVFRCITSHTSASSFELDHTNWGTVYASINTWETGIYYKVGSCVISHGNVYRCNTAHLSNDFDDTTENTYWDLISTGKSAVAEWEPNTSYKIGELLVYDGVMYKVTADFTSGATFSPSNMSPILGEPMTNSAIDNLWL